VIGALHAGTLQDLDERKGIDGLVRDRSSDHAGDGAGKFVEVPSVVAGQFVDLALMALAQQYGDSSGRKVRTARAGDAILTGGSGRESFRRWAALAEIERGTGSLYDAEVSRVCVALFREGHFEFSS
jgi:hypothetical protein